jgi:DNA-binding NarL/FixJ family response regulator
VTVNVLTTGLPPVAGVNVIVSRTCSVLPPFNELTATGARPRMPLRTGVEALTPSESRIAQMAAVGQTNMAIAQDLFVTLKTVEMHLTSTYRKLDIGSRAQLAHALAAQSSP